MLQPEKATDPSFLERLRALEPDVLFVVAYGKILRPELLAIPSRVSLNVHPSLLPRHRGASPIQSALLEGDEVTGVTIQKVSEELDAGDILLAVETAVDPDEHAGELAARLAELSAEASERALDRVATGQAVYTPQDDAQATYCRKLEKDQGRIDWRRGAQELRNHVRGMTPWPGARTALPPSHAGAELTVLRTRLWETAAAPPGPGSLLDAAGKFVVACGEGALELLEVKPAGKRAMDGEAFLRGARLAPGARLETPA